MEDQSSLFAYAHQAYEEENIIRKEENKVPKSTTEEEYNPYLEEILKMKQNKFKERR